MSGVRRREDEGTSWASVDAQDTCTCFPRDWALPREALESKSEILQHDVSRGWGLPGVVGAAGPPDPSALVLLPTIRPKADVRVLSAPTRADTERVGGTGRPVNAPQGATDLTRESPVRPPTGT